MDIPERISGPTRDCIEGQIGRQNWEAISVGDRDPTSQEAPAITECLTAAQAPTGPGGAGQLDLASLVPNDAQASFSLGPVTISTWNPVTMGPLENSTNLYFSLENTGGQPATLQLPSMTKAGPGVPGFPEWVFHFAPTFREDQLTLNPGAITTIDYFASKDVSSSTGEQAEISFTFRLLDTGEELTISVTVIASGLFGIHNWPTSSAIVGNVTSAGGANLDGTVHLFLLNEKNQLTASFSQGSFQLNIPAIDDVRSVLGPRQLPYSAVEYFLVVEAEGYSLGYLAGVSPATGHTLSVDIVLDPLPEATSYQMIGELTTDGPHGYWWVRFAGQGGKVVAVQSRHPPWLDDPGHIVARPSRQ